MAIADVPLQLTLNHFPRFLIGLADSVIPVSQKSTAGASRCLTRI